MDNFNRIVSFVLGLIVVIVFLIIINRRFNFTGKLFTGRTASATVTPTITPTPTGNPVVYNTQPNTNRNTGTTTYNNQPVTTRPQTIPSTGAETALLPAALSSLFAGIYLKGKARKNS